MQVIRNERTVFCDVDETLVLHDLDHYRGLYPAVTVKDPYSQQQIELVQHSPMIRLLKEELRRGATVIVMSRNGYKWASSVLEALDIDSPAIIVMSKPYAYMDDIPIEKWLTNRVYINPGEAYKND